MDTQMGTAAMLRGQRIAMVMTLRTAVGNVVQEDMGAS